MDDQVIYYKTNFERGGETVHADFQVNIRFDIFTTNKHYNLDDFLNHAGLTTILEIFAKDGIPTNKERMKENEASRARSKATAVHG